MLRRYPTPFCPSAALPGAGSYVARAPRVRRSSRCAAPTARCARFATPAATAARSSRPERAARRRSCAATTAGPTASMASLRHVPHEHGFPGLDKATRGLVPVEAVERQGLVFVTQEQPALAGAASTSCPSSIPPDHRAGRRTELEMPANWKILVEGFLEGYHIRLDAPGDVLPGAVRQPERRRDVRPEQPHRVPVPAHQQAARACRPPSARSTGKLTYVYHLFPNVMVATFPTSIVMVVLEPLAIDRTRCITYALSERRQRSRSGSGRRAQARRRLRRGRRGRGPGGGMRDPARPRERCERVLRVRPVRRRDRSLPSRTARGDRAA